MKENLVERVKDQNDSRYVRLTLTPLGEEKFSSILKVEEKMYKFVHQLFTQSELEMANGILSKVLIGTPLEETFREWGYRLG